MPWVVGVHAQDVPYLRITEVTYYCSSINLSRGQLETVCGVFWCSLFAFVSKDISNTYESLSLSALRWAASIVHVLDNEETAEYTET